MRKPLVQSRKGWPGKGGGTDTETPGNNEFGRESRNQILFNKHRSQRCLHGNECIQR